MTGSELSPLVAAQLASDVYTVTDELGSRAFKAIYKDTMEIGSDSMVTGKTGAFVVLKKLQVMAVFAAGKGNYKGQAFVAFKGTSSLYDALTDLNTGVRTSSSGCAVHQGFLYAFNSLVGELRQFLSALHGVHVVHVVGHSLGGAVATLAADWIKSSGLSGSTKLYTFGSPRVGLEMFASKCTSRLASNNIFRVFHETDPVPMVPTWPFHHVPTYSVDYLLWSPATAIPWEYHFMEHYIASVKQAGSWRAMQSNRPKGMLDASVERWLKSEGAVAFTSSTLELLSASLCYVFKKVANAAGILMVGGFATQFTLLDRMAIFLAKAANLTIEVSSWVYYLVKKMVAITGVVLKEGTSLTVEFIRAVFLRLHQKVSGLLWQINKSLA